MVKTNFIKITLDLLMSIVFVMLFNKMAVAGLGFHEIAGLSLGLAFIIHILLNFRWVKQVTLKIFSSKMNFKTRLGYIIDVLLLIIMGIIVITGVLISKVLFSNIGSRNSSVYKILHMSLSYTALLLIGIHIGLHWNWVMNVFKKIFKIPARNKILQAVAVLGVLLTFAFGAYNIYSTNYLSRVIPVVQGYGEDRGMNGAPPAVENSTGKRTFNGQKPERGIAEGHKGSGDSSTFKTIITNLSLISVFSIITYYIEKLITLKFIKKARITASS